jgi:hypothetical protein
MAVIYSSPVSVAADQKSWLEHKDSKQQPSPLIVVRTMEDFLFFWWAFFFCFAPFFVISLFLRERNGWEKCRRESVDCWNRPVCIRLDGSSTFQPCWCDGQIRLIHLNCGVSASESKTGERGTLRWIHTDAQKILREKERHAEFPRFSGSWRADSFVYLLV